MNLSGLGSVSSFSSLLQWERMQRWDYYPRLTVSGVEYGQTDLYDNGWVDGNMNLVDPLPSGATLWQFLVSTAGAGLTYAKSWSGTQMKCTWDGGAAVTGVSAGGDSGSATANLPEKSCTFTLSATVSGAPQGGNYSDNVFLRFSLNPALGGPPTNIKIFPAAYESRVTGGEIFDPAWLTEASQWYALRTMVWQNINGCPATDFADLQTDTYRVWGDAVLTGGRKIGPPPSVLAALANQSGRPIWVCIPHKFTDAAVTTFVQYLKDNVAGMVYYEYSNEVWNTGFSQTSYSQTQGALIPAWSGDTATTQGNKWSGRRAAQISEICRTVYGTDSGTRWTGVLCTQLGATSVISDKLIGVAQATSTTKNKLFSHIGIAPYVGPTPITAVSGIGQTMAGWVDTSIGLDDDYEYFNSQLYDQLKFAATSSSDYKNIKFWRTLWQSHITTAASNGMTVVMYEGGLGMQCALPLRDNNSGETEGTKLNLAFCKFARSEYAATIENSMNKLFVSDGGIYACKYDDIAIHSKYGVWGGKQYLGDTSAIAQGLVRQNAGIDRFRLTTS